MTYGACLEGDFASLSFLETVIVVFEGVFAFVKVLLQFEGVSVWFKC